MNKKNMNEKLKDYIYAYYSGHDDFKGIINFYNNYIKSYHGGNMYSSYPGVNFYTIVREFYEKEYNYKDDYIKLKEEYEKLENKNKGLIGENKNLNDKIINKDLKLKILFEKATDETKEYINELIKLGLLK